MSSDNFWLSITALAAAIDGNPAISEESLDQMERDLRLLDKKARDEMRRCMTVIVAQLARLEVRMMETDGPTTVAV
jgi:hypothetical protein